uniref:NADH-ubiquinone oxidoreductase chain 4 n=1 Tax=Ischalia sp. BMNH 840493 TaxID=904169 RepID=I7EGK1_9CUCU|nr:NADH dehydrogenase subunit 4 [Ischalia sp. BMNH 840493]
MMKFMFMMIFLMPLLFKKNFWFIQFNLFLITFFFIFYIPMNDMYNKISYTMGLDQLSYLLILLTLWICSLMMMGSEKIYNKNNWVGLFSVMIFILLISLILTFSFMNMFLFYLFFEVSLIPTLILILGWGYQPERLQAGIYLMFYTLLVSLPMMISIFYIYYEFNSLNFYYLNEMNIYVYLSLNMVFFVKMPMFFVHLWLPKAHVEAPVSGSMILAGIMLKLGGYGLIRVMKMFLKHYELNLLFFSISLIGSVLVSLICLQQSDMKSLVAYSSVSHMSMVLMGLMSMNIWGVKGAIIMMLAHGLCSSGLFGIINIMYERISSRSLYMSKGLINLMPSLSLIMFLLVSSNMAAPPSLNLMGEIMLINSIIGFNSYSMFMLMLILFFSAAYSLYLYSFNQHGKMYSGLYFISLINMREYLFLMLHWFPLNVLFMVGKILI